MQYIEFRNVKKYYKNTLALDDVSFSINKGDVCLFSGKNGSGKSTIIKLIMGVINMTKFDFGNIFIENIKIGYVPEKINLPKAFTVNEYLSDYFKLKRSSFDYLSLCKYFNLDVEKRLNELSKGMRQKVSLVLALADEFDLYILDEATNGLDDQSIELLVNKLYELKERNKTIIIVSHYKEIYEKLCTRKFITENGRILEDK